MEWAVQISGSAHDLREPAKSFTTPEASVTEENGQFVFRSDRFDPTADASTVKREAEVLIRRLDGALALAIGRRRPLDFGGIYRMRDDGAKDYFVTCAGGVGVGGLVGGPTVIHVDGSPEVRVANAADPAWAWFKKADTDPTVDKVLKYLTRDPLRWSDLRNIYETIELDVGGKKKIKEAGWASVNQQDRFTATANNYQILKEDACHAREDRDPPAKPMEWGEAVTFIKELARAWLNHQNRLVTESEGGRKPGAADLSSAR